MTRVLAMAALLGLPLMACAHQQAGSVPVAKSSPQDLAYCAKLSSLYLRYVGPAYNDADMGGVAPDVDGGEAVAKCREGDANASIPTLERLLRENDVTLPKRS